MMKRKFVSAVGLTAFAGLAHGEIVHWSQLTGDQGAYVANPALGVLTVDISGYASWGFQGDADNEILGIFFGIGSQLGFRFEWDVNLTSVGISWADEMTLSFNNNFFLQPGAGDSFTVENMNYQGSLDPQLLGGVDANGFLNIEFHETGFDDNPGAIDSFFEAGSYLYFIYPSPGTLTGVLLGGLVLGRRRRSRLG